MKQRKKANQHVITLSQTFFLGLALMILMTAVIMVLFYYVKQAGRNANSPEHQTAVAIRRLRKMGDGDYADLDELFDPERGVYFVIFDFDGKIIYSSSSDQSSDGDLSSEVFQYIPDSQDGSEFQIETFERDGETYYSVMQNQNRDGKKKLQKIYIFDSSGNLLIGSTSSLRGRMSEKLFRLVRNNTGEMLQKIQFTNRDGQQRYLIVHVSLDKNKNESKLGRLSILYHVCLALILLAALLITGFFIEHRVKDPILDLQKAIQKFSENQKHIDVESKGPAEIRTLTDAFNRMSAAIENEEKEQEKLRRQKDAILTDISHDLKTPITVMCGYIHALADGLIAPEEQKKYFDIIAGEADVLSDLIDTFGNYSKLNRAEYPINATPGDFGEFVRGFFAERYEAFRITECQVRVNIPEQEIIVNFDGLLMQRVLENIISNSLKYRTHAITLIVEMWEKKGAANLLLADTGDGIPASIKEDVFEPFVMEDQARAGRKSSGLGLSIVKKIIEMHEGTISLLSREEIRSLVQTGQIQDAPLPGFGACFLIRLPLTERESVNIKKH